MTKLQHLPEEVLNLWDKWDIRGTVLLSLLLQIILIIFGSWRKTIARSWIRILVWSAYLSADMVAIFALGNLARSQRNSSGDGSTNASNSIQAFWTPFLLLHLGGPDTITAYSIEDNELWLRHLLGLAIQVIVAFYVFSRSWGSNILTFIAIPVFIVGIIKYAERTWVLRSSCSKNLKNTVLSKFRPFYPLRSLPGARQQALKGNYLRQACTFFDISMFMMQDLVPGIPALMNSQLIVSANSPEDAFKVVEVELGLIYDWLHTKASLIYSRAGITLRFISLLLSFTAFVTFEVVIDKHAYSTIDITIAYLLLVGTLFLEIYALLCHVFSDWTTIWLFDGGNAPTSQICRAICSLIGKLTSKRWSRSIAQHNMISSCIENKPLKCLELFGIHEMMKEMDVNRENMTVGLQNFIFGHLQRKGEKIKENFSFINTNFRRKIIAQRGEGVLEREGQLHDFKWCTTEVKFSRSLLVWHVATDFCYCADQNANYVSERETSKCLSEYMMYLLVMRPNMLPKEIGDVQKEYIATCQDLEIVRESITTDKKALSKKNVVDEILHVIDECPTNYSDWRKTFMQGGGYRLVLDGGYRLAKQLQSLEFEKRWKMINEVWIEMLAHAAAHCPWKEHAQQLRRGGELLTHVCFLMLHLGLSEQYEYSTFDDFKVATSWRLTPEEERQCWSAIKKYELGDEDISLSSHDEEVKELKRVVANKDQEIKYKDQELEQMRSLLAASTQSQRLNAFPGGSSPQNDDQRTGNEIRLSLY